MSLALLSGIGLLLGVIALFVMAYKGFHNIYVAVAAVTIMIVFSKMDLFTSITGTMMGGAASYIKNYYLLFLGGAALGAIYQCTGAGSTIADAMLRVFGEKNVNFALMLYGYVAIMGGIQSFVAFFAVYPVALRLYKRANINKAIMPAVIGGGMWTIGHTSPWAPSVGNQVASDALGTSSSAGWVPGMIFVIAAGTMIVLYSNWASKRLRDRGKGFDSDEDIVVITDENLPPLISSLLPIIVVFFLYNVFHFNVTISTWSGVLIGLILFWPRKNPKEWLTELNKGAISGTTVAINTALVVSVGSVIGVLPFFEWLLNWITSINMNPYILAVVATGILASVTASASGALTIVFNLLGPMFREFGAQGYNINFIHRLTVQSVSCWDSLPHCGPLLGLFNVCKVTHKEAYIHVFITTIVIPIIACYLIELPIVMLLG